MDFFNIKTVWQAQNLPDGLSLNNGVISGVPTVRGTFDVPVTVSNELGSCTETIRIIAKGKNDCTILQEGKILETLSYAELQAIVQNGTAQAKYNCTNTQMLIDIIHPATGEYISNVALNFCSFQQVTLQDDSTKNSLILQFDRTLWKGFAPFGTNSFNRWKYSQLRKWLNASGADWFTASYTADILIHHEGSYTDSGVKGFLSCLPSGLLEVIAPVKVITQAFFDDNNTDSAIDDPDYVDDRDADVTYDTVFVPSLSEMGITFSDDEYISKGEFEGSAWEYYSALTGGASPCLDLNGNACSVISRSVYLDGTTKVLYVDAPHQASAGNVYNADSAPAPAFVIC